MSAILADRYARAFFEQTESSGVSDKARQDLVALARLERNSPEFRRLLTDPVVPADEKSQIFEACFQGKVEPDTLTFLKFMANRKRVALLPAIVARYVDLCLDAREQLPAVIESKVALSKGQVDKIKERFQKMTGKEILPDLKINPRMLGGFRVRIRNEIYDHTIESKLRKFKRAIVNH